MATKTKAKSKARRKVPAEQLHIEGTEPPRIKAIDDKAAAYYEVMMERVALSKDEDEAKSNLIEVMVKHGETHYETRNGFVVTVTSKSGVKCKKKHAAEDNGDGKGEDE